MKKQKISFNNINTYLVIALIIVVAIGLYFTLSVPAPKITLAPAPKAIQVTLLGADCEDCFNASVAIDFLNQQSNINITDIKELKLAESKELAEKYGIKKLPAVIVTGEIENLTIPNFNSTEDALIFAESPPPYYDVAAKRVKGRVTLTILEDKTCDKCFDISLIAQQLSQVGVKVTSERRVDAKSTEGKELIEQYKIEKIPTLIFNKEAMEYDVISDVWSQVGSVESDGKLILRIVNPPYLNVSANKVEGLVDITYLVDETCTECYNASMFKNVLAQSFNMAFDKETTVDVSSTKGKQLVKKYQIELVPTTILSSDASAYPTVAQAWTQAGTIEKDGTFVFRNVNLLQNQAYKNITSGNVIGLEEAEISIPDKE
ncbi:MAG TPA: hypothetical protein VI612_04995 [Candidatus Nanoarchaeia archaeon]|nr:hypothetical protein [Candidatus Nanoarchaeia archaeon]